jgi:ABC-type dipeptide/oligopeptide/nickel transport system permease subunit
MTTALLIALSAFVINIPLGYFRSRCRRYSVMWFVYVHLSVPLIFLARVLSHTDYQFIVLFILAAATGQYFGGRMVSRS